MKTLNLPLNTNFRMRCFAFTVALALSILSVPLTVLAAAEDSAAQVDAALSPAIAAGAEATEAQAVQSDPILVFIDGEQVEFDTRPVIIDGRTMVPFRAVFETLGYTVGWEASDQTVTAKKASAQSVSNISLQIGNRTLWSGGEAYESDFAPVIADGRTLVPVGTIGELTGYDVLWNSDTRTVMLYHKQAENYVPGVINYATMISDGAYIYRAVIHSDNSSSTMRIDLDDFSVVELIERWANDYKVHDGKLYGRFGESTELAYCEYDLATGEMRAVTDFDVATCYIYDGKLYFHDTMGPYLTTLYRMDLDGGEVETLMQGSSEVPVGDYAIKDDLMFFGYMDTLFAMPLDTMEPVDLIAKSGLGSYNLLLFDLAECGDCFYAAFSLNHGMTTSPLGILEYNYKTEQCRLIEIEHDIEYFFVTDNSIYYSTWESQSFLSQQYIYRTDINGKNPVLLAGGVGFDWVLSGNYLYFTTFDGKDTGNFARVATDGSGYELLVAKAGFNTATRYIDVATVDELIEAIGSNTCITLMDGTYDLSEYFSQNDRPYPGNRAPHTLYIEGIDGLTIQAEPSSSVKITTADLFSEVFRFENCSNITLSGFIAGHSVLDDYQCDAGVVYFSNTSNVTISYCYFYGSGTIGVTAYNCRNVSVQDTVITDCSRAAVSFFESSAVELLSCKLVDNRAYQYVICVENSDASFVDCKISGNKSVSEGVVCLYSEDKPCSAYFERCMFIDNAPNEAEVWPGGDIIINSQASITGIGSSPAVSLKDCELELGAFGAYWNNAADLGGNVLR